jgi:type IV secretion system protein TrbI
VRASNNYLKSTRTEPLGKYEIKAGWDIPAILEQGINSDLPGEAKALVRSNVYDTATGKYLLVPQGSRLIGTYNSEVAYGQNRVQAVWTRIIFPDGSSINLDGMNGHDAQGRTGFHDQVDNHYPRLFGFALLTSAFAAGIELSQRQNSSLLTTPTAGQTASAAAGQQLGELGAEVTRRNLNVQPSIKIRVGYRFNVRVNRDVLFDAPYRAIEM